MSDNAEQLARQYCLDHPLFGTLIKKGEIEGVLFHGPDEPIGGTFIPFRDLGYSQVIGFYNFNDGDVKP